jgi:molecular chaperone IbpA
MLLYRKDMAMNTFDLTPLFRSSIGFDRMQRMLDSASRVSDAGNGYPPYNIESSGENAYRITMAVAGFREEDLDVSVKENVLTISGALKEEDTGQEFLHRGIARRPFERRYNLADHIRVTDAGIENGLLHVELVREVPEAMKPRKIAIKSQPPKVKVVEGKAA